MSSLEGSVLAEWMVLGLGIVVTGYLGNLYYHLLTARQNVLESFSQIALLLKQRDNEMPKLVVSVQKYLHQEQALFIELAKTRHLVMESGGNPERAAELNLTESHLRRALHRLSGLVENTPEVDSNKEVLRVCDTLVRLESKMTDQLAVYNRAVAHHNGLIFRLPGAILARLFGFKAYHSMTFQEERLSDQNLDALFRRYSLGVNEA